MKNTQFFLLFTLALTMTLVSCDNDDDGTESQANLTLDISGLEDLGPNFTYEGWMIVDGQAITTGVFDVDAVGKMSRTSFSVAQSDLDQAATFVLTIEPKPDSDPSPSSVHILAGDFNGNTGALSVGHQAALNTDFSTATGEYILATPTDMDMTNEASGVWWLNPDNGPGPGLTLPTLPTGWKYEGWAVIDGQPVSTGTFISPSGKDDSAPFSGSGNGPNYPGEDFLQNAPTGLSFPLSLQGRTVVISVEPSPDNSTNPFLLKPLVHNVPTNADVHSVLNMNNNASGTNPTGTVTR